MPPDGAIVSFKGEVSAPAVWRLGGNTSISTPNEPAWEMALGAGGNLGQSIQKTKDKRLWDWGATKIYQHPDTQRCLHLRSYHRHFPYYSNLFFAITPEPIFLSIRSYLSVTTPRLVITPRRLRSIGQLDRSAVIQVGIRVNPSGKPVGCANCENNVL
jgi:hypothetical protein